MLSILPVSGALASYLQVSFDSISCAIDLRHRRGFESSHTIALP